ncbi:acetoacetate decarboxylase family protein [Parendozoicomonas haliclonae]|uniref:Acetoacetate decarboxylase n=1 Tax=Parendozoicomonas haliclonae TaxID=1960125 RepID=A0A1X7AIG7_9GAMM|nr:acetoacetate decarboxylase family protein [Parendozoicomonas haliclonae]SMA38853.1 acetoacetate decarboxylase [Parendozoicomonas haliclonae]
MKPKAIISSLLLVLCTVFTAQAAYSAPERRFTYHESDGVYIYYETQNKDAYRKLLPKEFDMPDRLYVYSFISDFYKMDARTDPYKEASIFLLAKHNGREVWHCIFMPVTSEISRIMGVRRLGLPKTMGDISLSRNDTKYLGTATPKEGGTMSLSVNTQDYKMSSDEENLIKSLSTLPKVNLLNGKAIEMSGGRTKNLLDIAKRFPKKLQLIPGKADITFQAASGNSSSASAHAFDLTPSKILGGYYLLNKFTFQLGKK